MIAAEACTETIDKQIDGGARKKFVKVLLSQLNDDEAFQRTVLA
jgi:hypothetical protein